MNRPKLSLNVLVFVALILQSCALAAAAKGAKAITPEALSQLFAARATCDTADSALRVSMQKASDRFCTFCKMPQGFPKSGADLQSARQLIFPLLKPNPYFGHAILEQQVRAQFPDMPSRAIIACDLTLNDNLVRHYRQFPPQDWVAAPGSIVIIHNDFDRFIVWGAGIDGKPLRQADGKLEIIERCTQEP